MRSLVITATAGALAAGALVLAGGAMAAPTGPTSPSQTVSELRAQGYDVIVNKIGAAPLDQCAVKGIRPGHTFSRTDSGFPGAMNDLRTTVTAKTVYLDVAC